jgi:tetratricopeptide (TPR) repeat protein
MTDDFNGESRERWPGLDLDDAAGPALQRSAAGLGSIVSGALSQVSAHRPWWRRKGAAPLAGVGVLVLCGAAAAASGAVPRWFAALGGETPAVQAVSRAPSDAAKARGGVAVANAEVQPPALAELPPAMTDAPLAVVRTEPAAESLQRLNAPQQGRAPAESEHAATAVALNAAPIARNAEPSVARAAQASALNGQAAQHSALESETPAAPARVAVPAPIAATPEDLLERASALRRTQQYAEALRVYEAVLTRYPGTRQARVARIAAAQIELSQFGDAHAAQRRFAEVEADAELGPEALFGTAEACRAQGDLKGEGRALQRLLQQHPDSPLAAAARRRLAARGGQ